jgi:hypothetical protein
MKNCLLLAAILLAVVYVRGSREPPDSSVVLADAQDGELITMLISP